MKIANIRVLVVGVFTLLVAGCGGGGGGGMQIASSNTSSNGALFTGGSSGGVLSAGNGNGISLPLPVPDNGSTQLGGIGSPNPSDVPEPSGAATILLASVGIACLALRRRNSQM